MKKLIMSFIAFFLSSDILASKLRNIEWKEISNKDNIVVFGPKKYKHESGLVPIRFKAILHHPMEKVLSVMADNKRKTEWLPNAVEIREVERKTSSDLTVYYRYELPWPFSNREFLIHTVGKFNEEVNNVSVDLISVERNDTPIKDSHVRGRAIDGYSIISPLGKNKTSVEMAFLNDFGGLFPVWIVNRVQRKWPYRFRKAIDGQLSKDDIAINPKFVKYSLR